MMDHLNVSTEIEKLIFPVFNCPILVKNMKQIINLMRVQKVTIDQKATEPQTSSKLLAIFN